MEQETPIKTTLYHTQDKQRYKYIVTAKPIYIEAYTLKELAQKMELDVTTVHAILMKTRITSFDKYIDIKREKKNKNE